MIAQPAARFPHIIAVADAADHTSDSIVGTRCDDQYEFEFAIPLLDGFEPHRHRSLDRTRR